jgi:hypothetical protein
MELFLMMTAAEIKQIVSTGTPVRKPVGNLYFRLNQYKVASWEFRYVINGKRRYMTIGKDPLVEKKRAQSAQSYTCDKLFDDWFELGD